MQMNDNDLRLLEFIENDRKFQSDYYNNLLQNKLYEQKIRYQEQIQELEKKISHLESKLYQHMKDCQYRFSEGFDDCRNLEERINCGN